MSATAWVTGGGTGIGKGIAFALANDGYTVYISGRREAVLESTAAEYAAASGVANGGIIPMSLDVTDEASVKSAVARIESECGGLDVLVAAAGINKPHRQMADTTLDDWSSILDINATGAFLCVSESLRGMRTRGSGLVVNIVSIAGVRALGMAGVAYCASKFAQKAMGIMAGNEAAADGVRVTNIYPGEVDTPILDQRPVPPPAEKRAQMVHPEDIGAVVSLISRLPATAHVSELVIKPRYQELV